MVRLFRPGLATSVHPREESLPRRRPPAQDVTEALRDCEENSCPAGRLLISKRLTSVWEADTMEASGSTLTARRTGRGRAPSRPPSQVNLLNGPDQPRPPTRFPADATRKCPPGREHSYSRGQGARRRDKRPSLYQGRARRRPMARPSAGRAGRMKDRTDGGQASGDVQEAAGRRASSDGRR